MISDNLSTRAKRRPKTTPEQKRILEPSFAENPKLNSKRKKFLSEQTGMTEEQIQHWFQNQRAKEKKKSTMADQEPHTVSEIPPSAAPAPFSVTTHAFPTAPPPSTGATLPSATPPAFSEKPSLRLPPLSDMLQRPAASASHSGQQPKVTGPTTSPGEAPIPLIPFFFHHAEFGIESCMLQWEKQRNY